MDIDKIINEALAVDDEEGTKIVKKKEEKNNIVDDENNELTTESLFEDFDSFCKSSAISAGLGAKTVLEKMRSLDN